MAAYENISGPQAERIKKNITKQFKDEGLSITIKTNLKIVNFLDITLDLDKDIFRPYIKPNDRPLYINVHSNHPPPIIRQLPEAVNRRISQLSHNEEAFNNAKPCYEEALHASGFNHRMSYETSTNTNRRNRTRKIIWYITRLLTKALRPTSETNFYPWLKNTSQKTIAYTKFLIKIL